MGGNLLKNWGLPEKRIGNAEYEHFKNHVTTRLYNSIGRLKAIRVAESIRNKETHGDLDVIISTEDSSLFEKLTKEFGFLPHKNSNVYSFPVDGFQVDVTVVPVLEIDSYVDYSSWGDLGNLMGRVFARLGLRYGHTGLSFWIRQGLFDNNIEWSDSDHIYEKFLLTNDMEKICKIGGFDYDRWSRGFDTEEDAFQFIINSDYFGSDVFKLENLNNVNRVRNKKRGMYMRFLEYLQTHNISKTYNFADKNIYSLIWQSDYPELRKAISRYEFEYKIQKAIKDKINGSLVKEWTGADGKDIGLIIQRVKNLYSKVSILEETSEKLKTESIKTFKSLNNENN